MIGSKIVQHLPLYSKAFQPVVHRTTRGTLAHGKWYTTVLEKCSGGGE